MPGTALCRQSGTTYSNSSYRPIHWLLVFRCLVLLTFKQSGLASLKSCTERRGTSQMLDWISPSVLKFWIASSSFHKESSIVKLLNVFIFKFWTMCKILFVGVHSVQTHHQHSILFRYCRHALWDVCYAHHWFWSSAVLLRLFRIEPRIEQIK